ncbi:MAG: GNAT family N-acetyltransferase [Planctomycetales bacterium]|nr:GNAT family N-acetyltransferase [Planctomycetales bacterium]
MSTSPSASVQPCPPELLKAALRVLHDGVAETDRAGLIQSLDGAKPGDFAGLFVAVEETQVAAAAWVQPLTGNMAAVWPPDGANPHATAVLARAAQFVDDRGFGVAQAIVGLADAPTGAALVAAGFPQLAELAYLFAEATPQSDDGGAALTFRGRAGDDPQRLGALLKRTYVASRDVPALEGARDMADVLASYRAQGEHLAAHWYRIECDGVDAAALLLAAHADCGNWELVYVGVAPEFRGRGWGVQIVRRALALAAAGGAERLVLAVDADNEPAQAMYAAAGFAQWDRRRVYARLRSPRATSRGDAG